MKLKDIHKPLKGAVCGDAPAQFERRTPLGAFCIIS